MSTVVVHEPVLIPVASLRANEDNPKRPMGEQHRRGLRASLDEFGMSGVLNVALEPDGSYLVLDGNTRREDLADMGVDSVYCIVHADMAHDAPHASLRRKEFVISYDAHRKLFQREKSIAKINELIAAGRDPARMSVLSGLAKREFDGSAPREKKSKDSPEDPAEAPADRREQVREAIEKAKESSKGSDSIVIHGPADEIAEARKLLAQIKGAATASQKLNAALRQKGLILPLDDETFIGVLLSSIARFLPGETP